MLLNGTELIAVTKGDAAPGVARTVGKRLEHSLNALPKPHEQ
jgi:hypothetical protein